MENIIRLYVLEFKSIPDISQICDISKSKVYRVLKEAKVLRSRKEGYDLA